MYFLLNMVIFQPAILVYQRLLVITLWYIYLIYHKNQLNVVINIPYMDGMGLKPPLRQPPLSQLNPKQNIRRIQTTPEVYREKRRPASKR